MGTSAHGYVVDDLAVGVLPASSGTWICALVPDTSLISRAVVVENALGPASGVGVTLIFWQTGTDAVVALGVGTTGRWIARVSVFYFDRCKRSK